MLPVYIFYDYVPGFILTFVTGDVITGSLLFCCSLFSYKLQFAEHMANSSLHFDSRYFVTLHAFMEGILSYRSV